MATFDTQTKANIYIAHIAVKRLHVYKNVASGAQTATAFVDMATGASHVAPGTGLQPVLYAVHIAVGAADTVTLHGNDDAARWVCHIPAAGAFCFTFPENSPLEFGNVALEFTTTADTSLSIECFGAIERTA